MKKQVQQKLSTLLACLGLMIASLGVDAQALTGIKTVPGDYSTISAAVAALNANGVGTGGVTIQVAAGHTETIPSTIVLTATGTLANPIVFQKSGVGSNPLITAYVGSASPTGQTPDGMWVLSGSDYITIDGIDLLDPASNTSVITTMEYGFGLFKTSGTNGCQNNTIRNCTITLNRLNNTAWTVGHNGSTGIAVLNSKYNDATTAVQVTATSGSNSYNSFFSNTIQNCNAGIAFLGFAASAPFILGDTLNDVGGSSALTGNTILNFGGATGASNPATGIFANSQWGLNVSYNTINSNNGNGINHVNALRGIFLNSSSNGASATVRFNTITVKGGGTTSQLSAIDCAFGGSYATNNTIDISDNTITNCTYTTATGANYYLIYLSGGSSRNLFINRNLFLNDSTHQASSTVAPIINFSAPLGGVLRVDSNIVDGLRMLGPAGSLTLYGIYQGGNATNSWVTVNGNSFSNITSANTYTGSTYLLYCGGGLTNGTFNIQNNVFNNLTLNTSGGTYLIWANSSGTNYMNVDNNSIVTGFTRSGGSGTFYGIYNFASTTGGIHYVRNNNLSNVTLAGTSAMYGIYWATSTNTIQIIRNNTISGYSGYTGLSNGIFYNYGAAGSMIDNNTVSNITAGGLIQGIATSTSISSSNLAIVDNTITGLTTTGAVNVTGIQLTSGTNSTFNIHRNKIYALSATHASGTAYGVNNAITSAGNTVNLFNNRISGITSPIATVASGIPNQSVGINSPMSSGNFNVYNNTVLLSGSGGVNFGSTALSVNIGATLDVRNNILINLCTPSGTGRTVVFRRGGSSLTTLAATTNNNILYAGDSTIAFRHIYSDGTNVDTLMSTYQTRMGVRETNSKTENTSFVSTLGSDPDYLRISPSLFTFAESKGAKITSIGVDANSTVRASFAGYAGTGGAPDMGAVEGNYMGDLLDQMTYSTAALKQSTGVVAQGSVNNRVMRMDVTTQQTYNALTATRFKVSTIGTTADSNILNAKIYYTGTDSVFATTELFGSITNPTGSYAITGSRTLATGTNYFWLAYDIAANATPSNLADANLDSVMINAVNYDFPQVDTAGALTILGPMNGNFTVGVGQQYTRITDALADLYTLGVSGPVTFTLKDTAYKASTGEVFPLVLTNYVGRSAINTVTIVPDAGIACRISNAAATPVFRFDNAQYFVIDGSQGASETFVSGNNLRIMTTNIASPTIEIKNESSNNVIKYADISGRNTQVTSTTQFTTSGVVSFQTTTGASGNDNNIIHGCDIHADSLVLPVVGVYSFGTLLTNEANNDGNVVDSCNIYDYFSPTTTNAGVYLNLNNSTWQITNNHFYQTASRLWTSGGLTHRAILITTASTSLTYQGGFVVSNNYIGGNNPTGTGLYTLLPITVGHLFSGIELFVAWGNPSSVQGNTIANISTSSSSTSQNANTAIILGNGNIDCGTVVGNTIDSITHTTNSAFGGGFNAIRGNAGGMYNIYNNTIKRITIQGSPATAIGEFIGINVLGTTLAANIVNNMIGDTAVPNSINNTCTAPTASFNSRMYGILVNTGTAGATINVSNNRVANMNTSYNAAFGWMKGIVMTPTSSGFYTVSGNTVYNLSSAARNASTGASSSLGGIVVDAATLNTFTVSNNTIHSLTLTDTASVAAVRAVGMFINTAVTGNNIFTRNSIHSISKTSANAAEVIHGIEIGGGNPIVANNMIRLGIDSAGASITIPMSIRGLITTAGNSGVYFNTVYIGGTGVGASTNRTFAFVRAGSGTDDVRNNIFANKRTNTNPGVGAGHFADSLANNTNLTQNFNILYADSIGVLSGTAQPTISNWQVASAVDGNSLNSDPKLLNPTGDKYTVSLAIDSTQPTAIEAYGQVITALGTDVDFYGNNRASLTPVDLGATAGNFIPVDLAAPAVTYTALVNTLSTGDRIITATITDATGVFQTASLAPRVYFKKSAAGLYTSSVGVKTSGTAQNGTWDFTISATAMGGLTGNDSVYYFIVAQDSSIYSNLGSTPGGIQGSDVNTISVYPALNSYKIIPIISGVIPVGVGQTLATLTGAGGAFSYINTAVLGGDLTLSITSDIEEPGTIDLNAWAETGAGNYRVRIVPSIDSLRSITGNITTVATPTSALIRINGADRVTIDGSYNGTGRYLRFMNRNLSTGTINLLNDADRDTIANCFIEGVNNTVGMLNFQTSTVANATGNDSNVVIGCMFRDTLGSAMTLPSGLNKPNTGIFSNGTASAPNDNNQVIGCEFNNIRYNSVNLGATGAGDNWYIYNNAVYQTNDSSFIQTRMFYIQGGGGHIIRKNSFGGSAVDRSGAAYKSYYFSTFFGIHVTSNSTQNTTIDSNAFGNFNMVGTGVTFVPMQLSGSNHQIVCKYNTVGALVNPWDTIQHVGSFYVYVSQPSEFAYNNVGNIYKTTPNTSGYSAGIYIGLSSGTGYVHDNYFHDIYHSYTSPSLGAQGPVGIYLLPSGTVNLTIERNTIANIGGINTGATARGISFNATISGSLVINANTISNVFVTNPSLGSNAIAIGIYTSTTPPANNIISNNMISLSGANGRVVGYANGATTTGANYNFHNNSIFITGSGDTSSYGLYTTNIAGINARNNIIYNKRVTAGGLGRHTAVGSMFLKAPSLMSTIDHNLFIVNDTALLVDDSARVAVYGWDAMNALYTNTYNTNWAAKVADVPADSLFMDTAATNLNIVTTNSHAWYANGKGLALAAVSGDYDNQTPVRSTTVVGGATDIGADEFTPMSTPPAAFADKTPTPGDSTQFYFGSRMVAKVNWDFNGILPTAVNAYYYSGNNAPNLVGGATNTNAYWDFQTPDGAGYGTMVTLMQDTANRGTVVNSANLNVVRYSGTGTIWFRDSIGSVNNLKGTFSSGGTFAGLGIFIGTEAGNNPLPVKLASFGAIASNGNVLVDWTTASEMNAHGFDVERSVDGSNFEAVGFVKATGFSNKPLSYVFKDEQAFKAASSNVLYYRLKQVDLDGHYNYSGVVRVSLNEKQISALSAYPNPFKADLHISFRAAVAGTATVRIFNMQGMLVSEFEQASTSGMNHLELDGLSKLNSGLYFVQLNVNGETTVIKMMKN